MRIILNNSCSQEGGAKPPQCLKFDFTYNKPVPSPPHCIRPEMLLGEGVLPAAINGNEILYLLTVFTCLWVGQTWILNCFIIQTLMNSW